MTNPVNRAMTWLRGLPLTRQQWLGLGIALFLLAMVGWVLWAILATDTAAPETTTGEPLETVKGEKVGFTITQNGRLRWQLDVDQAHYLQGKSEAILEGVHGTLYNDDGDPVAKFESPRGQYADEQSRITLRDGVTVTAVNGGTVLKAAEIQWSTEADRVSALGGVTIEGEHGMHSEANTANFTLDMSDMVLRGNTLTEIEQ